MTITLRRENGEASMTKSRIVAAFAILLGLAMIGGVPTQPIGQSDQIAAFNGLGLPAWFRVLVGAFEVLGGVLVIVPSTIPAGTLMLSTILVGALWAHVAHGEWARAIP